MPASIPRNVLVLGDVFGRPGCRALFVGLKGLVKDYKADVVVVNGENAADGFGITPEISNDLFALGVHVITSGNHIWQKQEIYPALSSETPIIRPANYPSGAPGKGIAYIEVKGWSLAVVNLQGREDMPAIDCPFKTATDILRKMRSDIKTVIIDFHAEAVEEKEALMAHLDGQVTAILGTHTHVQTADEYVSSKGTAYMTDIGMTGPSQSVIGADKDISIQRSLTQLPLKMEVSENSAIVCGALVKIDSESGRALEIEKVRRFSSL